MLRNLIVLFTVELVAAGSPCTTVGPPANPCTTAAPAPPPTTVTTTPPVTCSSFTCPHNSKKKPNADKTPCPGNKCNDAFCCAQAPCTTVAPTTVTTTPPVTCSSFTCHHGWNKKPNADKTQCPGNKCNDGFCCAQAPCTTVAPTTVTTTPPVTCSSFTCHHLWNKKPNADKTQCPGNKCNNGFCCAAPPPPNPCGTVAPVAPPPNPCGTVAPAARLYDAKQQEPKQKTAVATVSQKEAGVAPAWAVPLFGVLALFSLVSFLAVRWRRTQKSTRRCNIVDPGQVECDHELLLEEELVE